MHSYDDAMKKARQLAQTPEGQQLIGLLQQTGGGDLEHAVASGDMTQLRQTLSSLMKNPDARKLLEKMEW